MDKRAPVCNAAVEDFVHQRHYQRHIANVNSKKTSINNEWSCKDEETMQAIRARGKKRQQLNEDRQGDIDRENMRLLIRLHEIDRAPAKGPTQVRELQRIDNENQHLLRRLRGAKSTVNMRKINTEAKEKERLMRLRCEHQQVGWKADAFITKCASEGRLLPMAPESGLPPISRPESRGPCGRAQSVEAGSASGRPPSGGARPSSGRPASRPATGSRGGSADVTPRSGAATPTAAKPPAPRERTPLGGRIPAASRMLAEALMSDLPADEDAAEALVEVEAVPAQEVEEEEDEEGEPLTAEQEMRDAKEAAARAFLEAEAIDVSSHELMYGDLVKKAPAAPRRR